MEAKRSRIRSVAVPVPQQDQPSASLEDSFTVPESNTVVLMPMAYNFGAYAEWHPQW